MHAEKGERSGNVERPGISDGSAGERNGVVDDSPGLSARLLQDAFVNEPAQPSRLLQDAFVNEPAQPSRLLQEAFGNSNEIYKSSFAVANLSDWFGLSGSSDARNELKKVPPPDSALKDGDIIFHSSRSEQSEAIRLATDSPLSHCGILFKENGKWMVYEAVQPVKKTSLEQFAKRGEDGKYVVRRLKDESALDEESLSKMKGYLKSSLGKNYDLHFGWSDEKIYCSELVWKAYFKATGDRVGEVKPMREYDFSKPEVRKKVEQRWGKKLPLDELMVTPAGIYESKLLKTVR